MRATILVRDDGELCVQLNLCVSVGRQGDFFSSAAHDAWVAEFGADGGMGQFAIAPCGIDFETAPGAEAGHGAVRPGFGQGGQ